MFGRERQIILKCSLNNLLNTCYFEKQSLVWQDLGDFKEDLEPDFKLFSLLILVVHAWSLKDPSDATLASLSIPINPRWRPRWSPIISEKTV